MRFVSIVKIVIILQLGRYENLEWFLFSNSLKTKWLIRGHHIKAKLDNDWDID